jgi:glycosyltransferase involved in cell wall biosynthesis
LRVLVASVRGSSGIATYTLHLIDGLTALGHDVVVLDETGALKEQERRTIVPFSLRPNGLSRVAPFTGWASRSTVERIARTHEVDVVHVTQLDLTPRHERVVVTAWDPLVGSFERARAALGRGEHPLREAGYAVVDSIAARRAAAIIAVTTTVARAASAYRRPTTWIPAFLPDHLVVPSPRSPSHDVVMVANVVDDRRKGLEVAIDAVAEVRRGLPDVRLILVGDWSGRIRRDALPSFCDLMGHLSRDEVSAALRGAGCCILPSRWEEFGFVGLEALAAGTPLVCGPLPAFDEMSGGGVCRASERTVAAIAEQIRRALALESFDYPSECLTSTAVPRTIEVYERAGYGKNVR